MENVLTQLHVILEELNKYSPPPARPKGLNIPSNAHGKWVISAIGGGNYSLQAIYTNGETTVRAEPVRELAGRPSILLGALRFSVNLARAAFYEWQKV
jgi:hypothetical protein